MIVGQAMALWLFVAAVGALAMVVVPWAAACRGGRWAERRVEGWHQGGRR